MKKDPSLALEKFEIQIEEVTLELSLRPEASYYLPELTDQATGKKVDVENFTDELIPEIYNRDDLNQAINIIFEDFLETEEPLVTANTEIAEWERAHPLDDLERNSEMSDFLTTVEYIVKDVSDTALYDAIARTDDSLFCRYENVVVKLDFRYIREEE